MKICKQQHIAALCFIPQEDILAVHYLERLDKIGIPSEEPVVAALVNRTQLPRLTEGQKDSFKTLLEEFKDIFTVQN